MGDNWDNQDVRSKSGTPAVEDEYAEIQAAIDAYLAQEAATPTDPTPGPLQPPLTPDSSGISVFDYWNPGMEHFELPLRNSNGSVQFDFRMPNRAYNINADERASASGRPWPESRQEENLSVPQQVSDAHEQSFVLNCDMKPFEKPTVPPPAQPTTTIPAIFVPPQQRPLPRTHAGNHQQPMGFNSINYYAVTQQLSYTVSHSQLVLVQYGYLGSCYGRLIQTFSAVQPSMIPVIPSPSHAVSGFGNLFRTPVPAAQTPVFQGPPNFWNTAPPQQAFAQSASGIVSSQSHIPQPRTGGGTESRSWYNSRNCYN